MKLFEALKEISLAQIDTIYLDPVTVPGVTKCLHRLLTSGSKMKGESVNKMQYQ